MRVASRGGFTLVELLVVIGIVAVLIAILLPLLRNAREQARTVVCASNQRQLCIAVLNYAHDNRGVLPLVEDPLGQLHHPSQAIFQPAKGLLDCNVGVLWPYVSHDSETRQRLFNCPADPAPKVFSDFLTRAVLPRNFSFSFTAALETVRPGGSFGVPLVQVRQSAHKILIIEMDAPGTIDGTVNMFDPNLPLQDPSSIMTLLTSRHSRFCNEGFFDGHVELVDPKIFSGTRDSRGISLVNDASQHYLDLFSTQ